MEQPSLPTEVILQASQKTLGKHYLDGSPQPGAYFDLQGQTYAVLERRHRYQFKAGRYHLHQIALFVQTADRPAEQTWVGGNWVIGDANCRYNARSELLRCGINPLGPCAGCRHFERLP